MKKIAFCIIFFITFNGYAQDYVFHKEISGYSANPVLVIFDEPTGIAIDDDNNFYVVDKRNVQKFSSNGTFIKRFGFYGSGDGEIMNAQGIAINPVTGNIYVADYSNARIQVFSSDGTFLFKWGNQGSGDGEFSYPQAIAIDASGKVYVADNYNYRIQVFASDGTFITKWGSQGSNDGQFQQPGGIAVDASGNVFVADQNNNRIQVFATDGTFITKWGSQGNNNGQFMIPTDVAIAPSGNVYVSDYNGRIQLFTSTGTFISKFGSYGSGDGYFNNGIPGIAVNSLGEILATSSTNIQKFSNTGAFLTKWGSQGNSDLELSYVMYMAFDATGNIYATQQSPVGIKKYSNEGEYISKFGTDGSGNGGFVNPAGVGIDTDGNIYVVDSDYNNLVQKFSSDGTFILQWGGNGSDPGLLSSPTDIVLDNQNNVYIVDKYNNRIQKFSNTGDFLLQWGSYGDGEGEFNTPMGITIDRDNNLYVADNRNNRIQKFTSEGVFISQFGQSELSYPMDVVIDSLNHILVLNGVGIHRYDNSGTWLSAWATDNAGTGPGEFKNANSIAIDAKGRLYVADKGNARIQIFSLMKIFNNATTICEGQPITLTSVAASGNQWYFNGNPIAGATDQTIEISESGDYSATSTGLTSNTLSILFNPIPSTPSITAGSATTICSGERVTLTSSASSGNQWYLDGNAINGAADQTYEATLAGYYTVIETSNGCLSSESSLLEIVSNVIPSTPVITAGSATTICSGESVTLTSSASSGNQWYLNGNAINDAIDQTYEATIAGIYTVMETLNGCSSSESADQIIVVNTCTGIEENSTNAKLKLFPNPTSGLVEVQFNGLISTNAMLQVIDSYGNIVISETSISALSQSLDLRAFPKGLYMLEIREGNKQFGQKIVVQ